MADYIFISDIKKKIIKITFTNLIILKKSIEIL